MILKVIIPILDSVDLYFDKKRFFLDLEKFFAGGGGAKVVSFVNLHGLSVSVNTPVMGNALMAADLLLVDGIGVRLIEKARGVDAGLNMNGTDLIPEILDLASKDSRVAVYGAVDETNYAAISLVQSLGFLKVDGLDGFLPNSEYLQHFTRMRPNLVVLGLGMPKQEILAAQLKGACGDWSCVIINGGGILDFLTGKFKRAPRLMRKLGMEWLWRMAVNPRSKIVRNLDSVLFIIKVIYKIGALRLGLSK